MANAEHLEIVKRGISEWNAWRVENPCIAPNLSGADLNNTNLLAANLSGADLNNTNLNSANCFGASFSGANLSHADFTDAILDRADLSRADLNNASLVRASLYLADLRWADLYHARLEGADFDSADLSEAVLFRAEVNRTNFADASLNDACFPETNLDGADFSRANLRKARLDAAFLRRADFTGADLRYAHLNKAELGWANLTGANLSGADLRDANLNGAVAVETDFSGADLTGCHVYGISVWDVKLQGTTQSNLVITKDQPHVQVDDVEVAQFIHLLLNRQKLRDVITTLGQKAVLILGRFTERKALLDGIAEKLRDLGYLPIIFDFERPTDRDITETIKILAGLSLFVIADVTNPRSVPLELQATVPDYMLPFVTIAEKDQPMFSMLYDLSGKYHWALPLLEYPSSERLLAAFEDKVVNAALKKVEEVRLSKALLPTRRSTEN